MPDDSRGNVSDLWEHSRQEEAQLDAQRRVEAHTGGSGSESGDGSGGVCWPGDWDAEDYGRWSEGVNEAHDADDGAPSLALGVEVRGCGGEEEGMGADDASHDATQGERMAWDEEVDEIYAAEELEKAQRDEDERRQDQ